MRVDQEDPKEVTTRERVERILFDAMYPRRPEPANARRSLILNFLGWLVAALIPAIFIFFSGRVGPAE